MILFDDCRRYNSDQTAMLSFWQMNQRFEMLSNFQDLQSSILPLLQIMTGSGWYEYARAGTNSIGVIGFTYFCLYYFVVFFQFQRIFIAIIVQNFELNEDEKLQAQQMILEQKFEELTKLGPASRDDFFGRNVPGKEYDDFSFNRHYRELLRGAKLSLRELVAYSEHLASGGMGFSHENEGALAGERDVGKGREGGREGERERAIKMKAPFQVTTGREGGRYENLLSNSAFLHGRLPSSADACWAR